MAVLRPELLEIYSQSISDSSSLAAFNTDVFASSKCCGDPKEIQQDEESVEAAASFLMEVVIPNMVLTVLFIFINCRFKNLRLLFACQWMAQH